MFSSESIVIETLMSSSLEISKTSFTHMCILEEKEREERQRKVERQREMTKRMRDRK